MAEISWQKMTKSKKMSHLSWLDVAQSDTKAKAPGQQLLALENFLVAKAVALQDRTVQLENNAVRCLNCGAFCERP